MGAVLPMIKKVRNHYILFTQDGSKVLGTHGSRAEAEAQETAINISKARKAGHDIPPPKK